jgi:hypothetical protein
VSCGSFSIDDSLSFGPIQHISKFSRPLSNRRIAALEFLKLKRQRSTTMLLPRLQPPLRAALTSIGRSGTSGTQTSFNEAFAQLSIKNAGPVLTFVRHASHQQQGAVNKAKDGAGKRLGAKNSGGELRFYSWLEKLEGIELDGIKADVTKNNMSSQATSYSASEARSGFPARIVPWDAIIPFTPLNPAS